MLLTRIVGVRSVDFKIEAEGHGVVNWNGNVSLSGPDGKEIQNHLLPKLRGFTNKSGKVKEGTGYEYKISAQDIDVTKTPLYVSQNCLRHHIFINQSNDGHALNEKNVAEFLCSISGLLRGYVIPATQWKRKSPLLLEDLVEKDGNANFEQLGNSGARNKSSIFSKTTFGDTRYIGYGSINIEDLQFIPLDNKFDRAAMNSDKVDGQTLSNRIQEALMLSDPDRSPVVTFNECFIRNGTIFKEGEAGLLLNSDAIAILVDIMIEMISDLSINQAKGYMSVTSVEVDYNNSSNMMRIKRRPDEINEFLVDDYAVYYATKE
jgi:hypothetical protein